VDTTEDIPRVKEDTVKSFVIGQPTVVGHEALIKGIESKMKVCYEEWYGDDYKFD